MNVPVASGCEIIGHGDIGDGTLYELNKSEMILDINEEDKQSNGGEDVLI